MTEYFNNLSTNFGPLLGHMFFLVAVLMVIVKFILFTVVPASTLAKQPEAVKKQLVKLDRSNVIFFLELWRARWDARIEVWRKNCDNEKLQLIQNQQQALQQRTIKINPSSTLGSGGF